jgi:hypothetical protein
VRGGEIRRQIAQPRSQMRATVLTKRGQHQLHQQRKTGRLPIED